MHGCIIALKQQHETSHTLAKFRQIMKHPTGRRKILGTILQGSIAASGISANLPKMSHAAQTGSEDFFPDEKPKHKVVYQLNKAGINYAEQILNSMSAMLKHYSNHIRIALVVFNEGIHLLALKPKRPIDKFAQQRVQNMAKNYGVQVIACGNTLTSLGWKSHHIIAEAQILDVGAAALMELQEQGYAYIHW